MVSCKMNDSVLGIVITFIVLGLVLSIGMAAYSGVELPSVDIDIPQINAGTNTQIPNAYYDWCYKMNLDCS